MQPPAELRTRAGITSGHAHRVGNGLKLHQYVFLLFGLRVTTTNGLKSRRNAEPEVAR